MSSFDFLAPRKVSKTRSNAQEFHFLNVSESLEVDNLAKFTVRVQSSRDFHRRKRAQAALEDSLENRTGSLSRQPNGGTTTGRILRLKLGAFGLQPTRKQPKPSIMAQTLATHIPQWNDNSILNSGNRHGRNKDNTPPAVTRDNSTLATSPRAWPDLCMGVCILDPFNTLPVPQTPRIQSLLGQRESIRFSHSY
jgi:hypothetical protein